MTTLVIAEHDNATVKGATLNTVTAALQCGGDVHVLIAGSNAAGAVTAASQIAGVSKVLHADAAYFEHGLGKNVAPRVAAKLDVGQISDITKVDAADTFERPIYAGNAIATVQSLDAIKV